MKTRFPWSRCLLLLVSTAALASVWTVRERGVVIGAAPEGSVPSLRAEKRRLQAFSAEHLAKLAKERSAAEDAWRSRVTSLPSGWTEAPRDRDQLSTRHLRCLDPAQLSWSPLIAFVASLEERNPGKIISIDVRSKGTRRLRSIASVDVMISDSNRPGHLAAVPPPFPLQR